MRIWALPALLFLQDPGAFTVVSVSARSDATRVTVVFSRPVDEASAETPAHYAIAPGVKVESASRGLDLRTVTLVVSPLPEGATLTLSVREVRDCSSPPVAVAPGTSKEFAFEKGLFGAAPKEEPRGPRLPKVRQPLLFNTPEADAVLAALQVFPKNSAWNEDVSKRPVHPDSDKLVASIGKDKPIGWNWDMAFVIVPPDQPRVDVKLSGFGGESDKGPYPVPENTPIEGWPVDGRKLEDAQVRGGSDRHAIVVDPANGMLYEFYRMFKRPEGWQADCEATFDLKTNKMRPRGWTSSDAAGLPIFPSLPRFDELERGAVTHALRFTVARTRREFLYPARHQAGSSDSPAVPAMGQRFRLKASTDLAGFPKHARVIAEALKKHGMFVADNGSDWRISIPPDRRITGLEALARLKGSDFEAVATSGESELGR
jgi:hypothetical protein